MNKRAESVSFVVIIVLAFLIIGIGTVMLIKNPSNTANAVYEESVCFLNDEQNTPLELSECCKEIKRSTGCAEFDENYLICHGYINIKINKNSIKYCT